MRCLILSAALAVLGFGLAAGAAPPKPVSERDAQDFVYLGEKGPVLIRFHVQIDGKPLVDAWEGFLDKLFAYLDVNDDGVLSKEEAAGVPSAQTLFNGNNGLNVVLARPAANRGQGGIDKDRDGKITRQELADWYRSQGITPFQFRMGGGQRNQLAATFVIAGQMQPLSANDLNKKLFDLLDANKDGKLSRQELTKAPEVLHKLDLDDDEMVSVQEMSGITSNPSDVQFVVASTLASRPVKNDPFVMVSPGRTSKDLARRLQDRYAKGSQKLTRENLGLDEATFAQLDADQDGSLDSEELARFAQRAPDIELRVRLGKKAGKEKPFELIHSSERPAPLAKAVRTGSGNTLMLEWGNTQIEFGQGGGRDGTVFVVAGGNRRERYLAEFRAADMDKNGYLDKNEAQKNQRFRSLFTTLDRDGDGKLFEKELTAYFDKIEGLQKEAERSCASLTIRDQGRGLFDMVDVNSDGRLGIREMRQMVKLIDQLDRDGDGQVSLGEIPHKYRVDVRQGPENGGNIRARPVNVVYRAGMNTPTTPERTTGPRWFRKMDRNGDGDVSRREFLGTDEAFRKIDTDGDGLISVEEAERADKLYRKDKDAKR
jgi:Ca2+-binding EF-hand superfamily protein